MITRLTITLILLMGLFSLPLYAFNSLNDPPIINQSTSIFDRLSQSEILEVTLRLDVEYLVNNKNSGEYQPAILTTSGINNTTIEWDIEVKARGKYRRRVCDFPPIKLNFSKKDLEKEGLQSFDKMKLVTHCLDDKSITKELVLKEFLAYQLFNELTPNSFRVQLAKLTYIDSQTGEKTKRWGFFIEDDDELAARIGAEKCDCMGQEATAFHTGQERITSVFQYMIGNEDWSLLLNRNVKLFTDIESGKLIAVPYDFDFSGLVNAPYAVPAITKGLTKVTERLFMGQTDVPEKLYGTYSYFRSKKKQLFGIVKNFKELSYDSRKEVEAYLESFYSLIDGATAISSDHPNSRI